MAKVERDKKKDREKSSAFVVTSPVRLDQLSWELSRRMGWDEPAMLSADGSLAEASQDFPATLYAESAGVSEEALLEVVGDHNPDAEWGAPMPRGLEEYPTIRQKAIDGETLTDDELRVAVSGLLRDSALRNL